MSIPSFSIYLLFNSHSNDSITLKLVTNTVTEDWGYHKWSLTEFVIEEFFDSQAR